MHRFISKKLKLLLIPLAIAIVSLYYIEKRFTIKNVPASHEVLEKESILLGKYYQVSVSFPGMDKYLSSAEYRVWIPKGVEQVRGILVKQHGCGIDAANSGLDHANDLQWQALALKHQFALMGTSLVTRDGDCRYWAIANYASKDAFLKALDSVAEQSKRPEMNQVPWVLWGHSGGANWAVQMLQEYPQRTIAMVALRAGGLLFLGTNSSLIDVPVLFSLGEKENVNPDVNLKLPQKIFRRYRKSGALWTLAIEANANHGIGNTRQFVIPYLDAVIAERLDQNSNQLSSLDRDRGWLADNSKHQIASVNEYEGNPQEASWLPNREIARKWQEYVTAGKISPTSKPKAPIDIIVSRNSPTEALISWNFIPDLENGLPSFRIYRDGLPIKTLKIPSHNSGDASKTAHLALRFLDRQAVHNSTYTVAAFNELGETLSRPQQDP